MHPLLGIHRAPAFSKGRKGDAIGNGHTAPFSAKTETFPLPERVPDNPNLALLGLFSKLQI